MKKLLVVLLMLVAMNATAQWSNISLQDAEEATFLYLTKTQKIFAGTSTGLYVSTDFGTTWNSAQTGMNILARVVSFAEKDSLLFAGADYHGFYKSTNNGQSWTPIQYAGFNNRWIYSIIVSNNIIFVAADNYIYKSTNNGVNWTNSSNGIYATNTELLTATDSCLFASCKSGSVSVIYRSTDKGLSWSVMNHGLINYNIYRMLGFHDKLYGASQYNFCVSTNNGTNWSQIAGNYQYSYANMAGDFTSFGGYGVLGYLQNGTTNLTTITTGLANLYLRDVIVLYPNILINTNKGFYKSTNGGTNWTKANNGYINRAYKGSAIYGNRIFSLLYNTGKLAHKDIGVDWYIYNINTSIQKDYLFRYTNYSQYVFSENILYSGTFEPFQNWQILGLPSPLIKLFDAQNNLLAVSNSTNNVYKSTNEGINWILIDSSGLPLGISKIISLTVSADNSILIGMELTNSTYELYRRANSNTNWTKMNTSNIPGFRPLKIVSVGNELYGSNISNVYYSSDYGQNWNLKNQGLINDTITGFAMSDNKIFLSTRNNGVYRLNNQLWSKFNTGLGNLHVNSISGYFANLVAATDSGLYYADVYSSIKNISSEQPPSFALGQNYPNPFNPITNVKFSILNSGDVKLVVFDIMGREVQTLVNERLQPGTYETSFDGSMLNSGVYFYKMVTDGFTETKRMVLIK